jgi:hypothetical protein
MDHVDDKNQEDTSAPDNNDEEERHEDEENKAKSSTRHDNEDPKNRDLEEYKEDGSKKMDAGVQEDENEAKSSSDDNDDPRSILEEDEDDSKTMETENERKEVNNSESVRCSSRKRKPPSRLMNEQVLPTSSSRSNKKNTKKNNAEDDDYGIAMEEENKKGDLEIDEEEDGGDNANDDSEEEEEDNHDRSKRKKPSQPTNDMETIKKAKLNDTNSEFLYPPVQHDSQSVYVCDEDDIQDNGKMLMEEHYSKGAVVIVEKSLSGNQDNVKNFVNGIVKQLNIIDDTFEQRFPVIDHSDDNLQVPAMWSFQSFWDASEECEHTSSQDHRYVFQTPLRKIKRQWEERLKEEFKVGNVLPNGSFCLNEHVSSVSPGCILEPCQTHTSCLTPRKDLSSNRGHRRFMPFLVLCFPRSPIETFLGRKWCIGHGYFLSTRHVGGLYF